MGGWLTHHSNTLIIGHLVDASTCGIILLRNRKTQNAASKTDGWLRPFSHYGSWGTQGNIKQATSYSHQTDFISFCLCCTAAGRDLTDNWWLVTHFELLSILGQKETVIQRGTDNWALKKKKNKKYQEKWGSPSRWRLMKGGSVPTAACVFKLH